MYVCCMSAVVIEYCTIMYCSGVDVQVLSTVPVMFGYWVSSTLSTMLLCTYTIYSNMHSHVSVCVHVLGIAFTTKYAGTFKLFTSTCVLSSVVGMLVSSLPQPSPSCYIAHLTCIALRWKIFAALVFKLHVFGLSFTCVFIMYMFLYQYD